MRRSLRRTVIGVLSGALVAGAVLAGPPASAGGERWPVVKANDTGLNVRAVQALLSQHGFAVRVTGWFGHTTVDAVEAFQDANGLDANGVVGRDTWRHLIVVMKKGAKGDVVRVIQMKLAGKYGVHVDGKFNKKTQDAVKKFEADHGVAPDGIVEARAWKHLLNYHQR